MDRSLLLILLILGAVWLVVNEIYGEKPLIVPFVKQIIGLSGKVEWGQ